jgi:MFS family permease
MALSGTQSIMDASPRTGVAKAYAALSVAIVLGSYVINAMDRTLFPLILPEVRGEYGFDLPEAGLMATVFTIGMALAGLPSGYLLTRFTRRFVVQLGIFIFSAATVVTVLAAGFGDMLAYRAITGIGEAMQLTALLAIVSSYFARYPGVGIGAVNCAFGLGAVFGPLLGATLLAVYGTWRAPMIAFGIIGLRSWFGFPGSSHGERSGACTHKAARCLGRRDVVQSNTVILVLLSCIAGLAIFGFLGMYPTYLREELHFTPAEYRHNYECLRSRRAGLGGRWIFGRPISRAAGAGGKLPGSRNHWLAVVQWAGGFYDAGGSGIRVRRGLFGCDLRQSRRLPCQSSEGRAFRAGVGHFRDELLYCSFRCGYSIGWLAAEFGWTFAATCSYAPHVLSASCLPSRFGRRNGAVRARRA